MKKHRSGSKEPSHGIGQDTPPFAISSDVAEWIKEEWEGQERWVLLPHNPQPRSSQSPDDYLEFVDENNFEQGIGLVKSGLTIHAVELGKYDFVFDDAEAHLAVNARKLNLGSHDDLVAECFYVLKAHGWYCSCCFGVAAHVRKAVEESVGADRFRALYELNSNAEYIIQERAASILTKPLSRLWYAANMLALLFVYQDMFRLGYLWAEYKNKLVNEGHAIIGIKVSEGGRSRQGKFAKHTPDVLDNMARLMDNGHSCERAAQLALDAGFGTSRDANVKLWTRHNPAKK